MLLGECEVRPDTVALPGRYAHALPQPLLHLYHLAEKLRCEELMSWM